MEHRTHEDAQDPAIPKGAGVCVESARCLLEAIDLAVLVVGSDRRILFSNRRAAQLLDQSPATIREKSVEQLFAPIEAIEHAAREHRLDDERQTTRIQRANGVEVIYGFRATRLTLDDAPPRFAVIFQDVTKWEALRKQRDRALQLAVVGDIMPTILNELKNPLAAVVTAVEILFEDAEAQHLQQDLHAILGELRRMKMVLEGIGSSGRPVRNARHEAIDLALWEALRVLELQARSRKLKLESDVPAMPLLPFDAAILRGVLFNLVQNAQHASPPGARILVKAWCEEREAFCIRVQDHGMGMTKDQLARCRELFYSTKQHASGIGLTMCQRVADEAEGQLTIESAPNLGTTVTLRLPTGPSNRRKGI